MKKWIALLLTAVLVISICGCTQQQQADTTVEAGTKLDRNGSIPQVNSFSVGYSRMDITPQEAVPISGITAKGTDRMSTSVHDSLQITCIAMTDANNKTLLFFTFDLQRPDPDIFDYVAMSLEQATGLSEEHMYFTATHTHSGPDTYDDGFPAIDSYKLYAINQGVEAGIAALEDRKPAEMYYSQVETESMNFVRHYSYIDDNGELYYFGDQYHINSSRFDETTKHVSEADPTMYVVRFAREDAKDVVMVNWRAHPHLFTSASSFKLSADFVGAFREAAEMLYDCNFAYYQGAAGNVNNKSKISSEMRTMDYGEYGRIMAEYMLESMKNETKVEDTTIQTRQNQKVFEQNHTTDHLVAYATICRQMWVDGYSTAECEAYGMQFGVDGPVASASIIARAKRGDSFTSELNAIAIGDTLCIVTAPHELFDTNSMWLEGQSPYEVTLTFGYTNGMNGYVPSAEAFEYGCYEANCTHMVPGGGELLQEEFLIMLNDMFK